MSIRVQNVSKRFGTFTALNDVTLDFPPGELVALLGPSGCGKTTLLRTIAGLAQADSGRVFLEGNDATDKHVRERNIGFVFQHYALFWHMSVFENVAFGLRVKPRHLRPTEAQIRKKVTDLLELVQLGWLANNSPATLSGGQRQRIALARALAVEPKVLLLDEPFGALDAKVRKELRRWLRQLHDELHISSIFVTHDQEEALELADRVVLMNRGRIEQIGTPQEVYHNPASAFVYGFLGPSNIFQGTVAQGTLAGPDFKFAVPRDAASDGTDVTVFVRPHEMKVAETTNGEGSILARVHRVIDVGPVVRVELTGAAEGGEGPRPLEIVLPAGSPTLQTLRIGENVHLVPDKLRVFPRAQDVQ